MGAARRWPGRRESALQAVGVAVPAEASSSTLAIVELAPLIREMLQTAVTARRRVDLTPAQLGLLSTSLIGLATQLPAAWRPIAGAALPVYNGDRPLGTVLALACAGVDPADGTAERPLEAARAFDRARSTTWRRAPPRRWKMRTSTAACKAKSPNAAPPSRLLESGRRMDEFLAMLSHELRNPLAPIRTALDVIRRIAPADPESAWDVDIMVRQPC
ncbi:MAG: histidine kinase dimerization/phospho-acceptor domain-containing protein [Burkholderiaceae bacterium]